MNACCSSREAMMLDPKLVSLPRDGRQSETALAVARGARRLLRALNYATLTELTLASGRRADIIALTAGGDIHIVEIKSSVADFRADSKWTEYRDFCDRFYFAVPHDFPVELIPGETGLIIADAYGAEINRDAPVHCLAAARRRAVLLRFAQAAANRLHALGDPEGAYRDD